MIYIYQGSSTASETGKTFHFVHVWLVTVATIASTFSPSTPLYWPCLILDMRVKEIANMYCAFNIFQKVGFLFCLAIYTEEVNFANVCHDLMQNLLS